MVLYCRCRGTEREARRIACVAGGSGSEHETLIPSRASRAREFLRPAHTHTAVRGRPTLKDVEPILRNLLSGATFISLFYLFQLT